MEDRIDPIFAQKPAGQRHVTDIPFDEMGRVRNDFPEAGREIVENHDIFPGTEKLQHHVASDIARTACNKHAHASRSLKSYVPPGVVWYRKGVERLLSVQVLAFLRPIRLGDPAYSSREDLMPARIRKAVFPVAGLGTRFLPATKAMPKEMLTVVDKPLIQHVVEEAREAGIEHFVFVTGRNKGAIEDHFDRLPELEETLAARGKTAELEMLASCLPEAGCASFVRQPAPLGLGHAVWCAREIVGNEPFAVILPDVLVQSPGKGCLAQMLDVYNSHGGNILAVEPVSDDQTKNYGVVAIGEAEGNVFPVTGMVEKPAPGTAPSNLTILGRYILQPEMFDLLAAQEKGSGGEIQLTDSMLKLLETQPFFAVEYEGRAFDCGSKPGFLAANVAYALERPDLRDAVVAEIKKLL